VRVVLAQARVQGRLLATGSGSVATAADADAAGSCASVLDTSEAATATDAEHALETEVAR
jgi:hypothetical protein